MNLASCVSLYHQHIVRGSELTQGTLCTKLISPKTAARKQTRNFKENRTIRNKQTEPSSLAGESSVAQVLLMLAADRDVVVFVRYQIISLGNAESGKVEKLPVSTLTTY